MAIYYAMFFFSIGSAMPFAALWFETKGISTSVTGALFAAPSILVVLVSMLVGSWADRLSDWRTAILVCNWVVLALFGWLLLRSGSHDIMVVWVAAGIATMVTMPVMDAASLSLTSRRGSNFGRVRAFGSIGFIVGVVLCGALFDRFGIHWFVPVLVTGAIARIISAHRLPRFRNELPASVVSRHEVAKLMHPGFLLVVAGSALITASHSFNNVFGVLHWTGIGISTTQASMLWSVSVIAEVLLMWSFSSLAKSVSARRCLLIAALVGAIRWTLIGTEPGLLALFVLQTLHAITFGLTFLATVNFISNRVDDRIAARAQAVSATMVTLAMAVANWFSGWVFGSIGAHTYWIMGAVAMAGGLLVSLSYLSNLQEAEFSGGPTTR